MGRSGRAVTSQVGWYLAARGKQRFGLSGLCWLWAEQDTALAVRAGAWAPLSRSSHALEHRAEIIWLGLSNPTSERDVKELHHSASVTECGAELWQIDVATPLEIASASFMWSCTAACFTAWASPEDLVCSLVTVPSHIYFSQMISMSWKYFSKAVSCTCL